MANQSKKDPHPTATKEMSFEDGSGAINMGQLDQTNQDLSAQKPRQDFLEAIGWTKRQSFFSRIKSKMGSTVRRSNQQSAQDAHAGGGQTNKVVGYGLVGLGIATAIGKVVQSWRRKSRANHQGVKTQEQLP